MIWTLLGCGTSTGVPVIQCQCRVCRSKESKNKRLRASVWVQVDNKSLVIDTTTDFRQQMMRANIKRIDAVLYTHPHADHIHGIDDLRCYNWIQKKPIPVWGNRWTSEELLTRFSYAFGQIKPQGGAIPKLELHTFSSRREFLNISGINVVPLSLEHGTKETVGFRIRDVAYVTDCNNIPARTFKRLHGLKTLFLDCVRIDPHSTHFNLEKALLAAKKIGARKTYLTHLGHDFDYYRDSKTLPKGVEFAYDGLKVKTT